VSSSAVFGLNVVAITILTFGLYFPRHRRRDLVVSYLGVNIGVLAVTEALTSAEVTAGLGLGLLGVLSIIRLRSFELDQQEVAYYFVSLALGVLGGVTLSPSWLSPALMAALLVAVFVGDHPRLFARYRVETITLDAAYTDESALVRRLEDMLGARVHRIAIRRVDLVNDTTNVEVRFEILDLDTAPPGNPARDHELLP
jgi:molybdopterin converting factor small subunit